VIADRTAYDLWYSCWPLCGIAVTAQVFAHLQFQTEICFVSDYGVSCRLFHRALIFDVLWLNDTSYSKGVWSEVDRKCRARNTTVQLSIIYTDPERHSKLHHRQTDRRTDRQTDDSIIGSHCVQQYDRLGGGVVFSVPRCTIWYAILCNTERRERRKKTVTVAVCSWVVFCYDCWRYAVTSSNSLQNFKSKLKSHLFLASFP